MKIRLEIEHQIEGYKKALAFVDKKKEAFNQLEEAGIVPRLCGYGLDFDNLSREQVKFVISTLRCGRWDKSPNYSGKDIDYVCPQDGFNVRLYAAAPPSTCQLIEEEYEEPPQPARIKKRYKLVCSGSPEAV